MIRAHAARPGAAGVTGPAVDADFEALLELVRDNCAFDFTGYKRSTLTRRVRKRMQMLGIED